MMVFKPCIAEPCGGKNEQGKYDPNGITVFFTNGVIDNGAVNRKPVLLIELIVDGNAGLAVVHKDSLPTDQNRNLKLYFI
ncbi:hypothetical protein [Saezia sanguinis]|uniref:hypothetical protein n=1 Tax=Saezia sanguinis TaxID=1965230 RepID=UPI0013A607A7|nr:hypothetical protein [Saezia sanguinis]